MVKRRGEPKTTGTGRMRIAAWLKPMLVERLDAMTTEDINRSDLIEAGVLLILSGARPADSTPAKSA